MKLKLIRACLFGVQTTGCKEQIWVLFAKTPKIEAERNLY